MNTLGMFLCFQVCCRELDFKNLDFCPCGAKCVVVACASSQAKGELVEPSLEGPLAGDVQHASTKSGDLGCLGLSFYS